ncbi:MAG: hypothetical protein M0P91_07845 [Sulfuricurvum sp.]|jgi:hypothetical protein|uniref:hypothetical protein n=1 Tax=Sulfuricurvum sp. TaxID=2025608 RepID=UPI0025E91399|nr:hypothetical protein [Sulfuricurvum sp.]MCK9373096.1 hypothetical protein [Sulfuricurvum sp.]
MDLVTISTALSSLKSAYDLSKVISESADSLEQAEIKLKLAELMGALADTKSQISDIKLELITKNEKIQELENQIRIQNQVKFEQPYYWKITNDNRDGPYCQKCYDDIKKLIRLQDEKHGSWRCLVCSSYFRDKNYKEESFDDSDSPYNSYV